MKLCTCDDSCCATHEWVKVDLIAPKMGIPKGTTPNYKLDCYSRIVRDFPGRVTDSIRVLYISPIEMMTEGWGISRSEARRRLRTGTITDCTGQAVGASPVLFEPGCFLYLALPPHGFAALFVVDLPRGRMRRLKDKVMSFVERWTPIEPTRWSKNRGLLREDHACLKEWSTR